MPQSAVRAIRGREMQPIPAPAAAVSMRTCAWRRRPLQHDHCQGHARQAGGDREAHKRRRQKKDPGRIPRPRSSDHQRRATDVAEMLNKIFSQELGARVSRGRPAWQRMRRWRRDAAAGRTRQRAEYARAAGPPMGRGFASRSCSAKGCSERAKKTIRLCSRTSDQRADRLRQQGRPGPRQKPAPEIDKPSDEFQDRQAGARRPAQIHGMVSTIAQNLGTFSGRGPAPSIVLDEPNKQFYIMAEREQIAGRSRRSSSGSTSRRPKAARHVVRASDLLPSRVADSVRAF